MNKLLLARPQGNAHPNIRRVSDLINVLSQPPHFPYSASILGTLLAPLAVQSHYESRNNLLLSEADKSRAATRYKPLTAPEVLQPNSKLAARWVKLTSLSDASPYSRHSYRYVCFLGHWPGSHPSYRKGEWAVGVIDTDGLLNPPGKLNFRFYSSTEHYLLGSKGVWADDAATNSRPSHVPYDFTSGSIPRPGERPEATRREKMAVANKHLYLMMADIGTLQRPMTMTDFSVLHLPYLKQLAHASPYRNADYKLLFNPQVIGERAATKFFLPPDVPLLNEYSSENEPVVPNHLRCLADYQLPTIRKRSGRPETSHYLAKGLPFTSCQKGPDKTPLAWITVRNDLSLSNPYAPSRESPLGPPASVSPATLVNRTILRVHAALRYSSLPESPAANLLKCVEPAGAPFHATIDNGDIKSRGLFTQLGWRELAGDGVCDLELEFTRAIIQDPPLASRTLGGIEERTNNWAELTDDGSRLWEFPVKGQIFANKRLAKEAFPPAVRTTSTPPRWRHR